MDLRVASDLNRDLLESALTRANFHRMRQSQRRAMRVEAGVNPIALVFHFEHIPGEFQFDPTSGHILVSQCDQIGESRHRLFRRNGLGKTQGCGGPVC